VRTQSAIVTTGTAERRSPARGAHAGADQPGRLRTRGQALAARIGRLSLLHLLCIVVAVGVFGAPLIYILLVSFNTETGLLGNAWGWPSHFTFANYSAAWVQGDFFREILNSVLYAAVTDAVSLVLGVFLAFPVSRGYLRRSNLWYAFFIFSGFLPPALIPLFIEARWLHIYNNRLGYMLILSLQGAGFFFFVGYIKGIPREREEAAAIDGCSYIRFVFTILMREMKPALAAFAVFGFVGTWNLLILPIILLPKTSLFPVTRGLYSFFGSYQSNEPEIAAATIIVSLPLLVVFLVLQRYLVQGVAGGAMGVGMDKREGQT